MRTCFFCLFVFFWVVVGSYTCAQDLVTHSGEKLSVEKCLELADQKEKAGDFREASRYLNHVATVHWEKKEFNQAIGYFQKSLSLNQQINNLQGATGIHTNLGMIYADMQQYQTSFDHFQKALDGRRRLREPIPLVSALINNSVVLNNLKRHQEAAVMIEEALNIARERNDTDQMKSCYGFLAETYEKAGDNKKSLDYFNLYRSFHEMVQRDKENAYRTTAEEARLKALLLEAENKNKELEIYAKERELAEQEKMLSKADAKVQQLLDTKSKQELALAYMSKEKQLQALEAKEQEEMQAAKLRETRLILAAVAIVCILLGVLAFFIFRSYREKKQTNRQLLTQQEEILAQKENLAVAFEEINRQNEKITSSIAYAQRIQSAMMTDTANLQKLVPESFIFFRPRDVVSGDFYFFRKVGDEIIIAAVDCTGHGVPGAFMSMIGMNLLYQATAQGITSPGQLLQLLHEGISASLNQQDSGNRDGMDAALIAFNRDEKRIRFAGAKNPLIYVQEQEVIQVGGSRQSIGGLVFQTPKDGLLFEEHAFHFQKPTWLYIYSDGYQDQFGGDDHRKFMSKRLRALLGEIHTMPAARQEAKLGQTLTAWQGKEPQTDDVLVLGIRV